MVGGAEADAACVGMKFRAYGTADSAGSERVVGGEAVDSARRVVGGKACFDAKTQEAAAPSLQVSRRVGSASTNFTKLLGAGTTLLRFAADLSVNNAKAIFKVLQHDSYAMLAENCDNYMQIGFEAATATEAPAECHIHE
ncbi:uncharacterized protein UDID_18118 [Ustilago sp. UG-2017a]|nr:uncharacterized protein UDID_18118 [Ustilago sp. UG-2017a]